MLGREKDVGIICVIIYDDLALEAWTQSGRQKEREKEIHLKAFRKSHEINLVSE